MKIIFLFLLLPMGLTYGQNSQPSVGLMPANPWRPVQEMQAIKGIQRLISSGLAFSIDTGKTNLEELQERYLKNRAFTQVLQGRFSHRTGNGSSVFTEQPDNMACLVPDLKKIEWMPNKNYNKSTPVEPMPTIGPSIHLIPENKEW